MKPQGGEQADHAAGHRSAGEGEAVVLTDGARGYTIQTTGYSLEIPARDETAERLPVHPSLREFPGTHALSAARELQRSGKVGG